MKTVLINVALFAASLCAIAFPLFVVELLTNPKRVERLVAPLQRLRRSRTAEQPTGPALEKLAVEIRRLGEVLADPRPISAVRWMGVQRAYDESLIRACQALGIEHQLDTEDADRNFERLRIEAELQEAGLVLRAPVTH
jgi:hypothetical protein